MKKNIRLLMLLTFCAAVLQISCVPAPEASSQTPPSVFKIAGGSPSGGFNEFIRDLAEATSEEVTIEPTTTAGGGDNLDQLENGYSDFGLAQNDLAYWTFEGERSFAKKSAYRAVLPLFQNYQQVFVRADSPIESFSDLEGKAIAMGARSSASYLNAEDVFARAGIQIPDVDRRGFPIGRALAMLSYCTESRGCELPPATAVPEGCEEYPLECQIDVVIVTGSWRVPENTRHIAMPGEIVRNLASEYPYYSMSPSPADEATMLLSTTTYLLAHKDTEDERVDSLTRAILSKWSTLKNMRDHDDLVDINYEVLKRPFPWHSAARGVLIEQQMLFPVWPFWAAVGAFFFMLFAADFVRTSHSTYDRLGQMTAALPNYSRTELFAYWMRSVRERLTAFFFSGDLLSRVLFSAVGLLYVMALVSLFIVSSLIFLKWAEGQFATSENAANALMGLTFVDSLIWVFTWMGTGFELQGIYPLSPWGRVFAVLVGVVGVAAPVGLLYKFVADWQARRASRARGEDVQAIRSLRRHTLICGWNDKVPGLIYSWTGRDAPEKKRVVVVAEMADDFPLRKYNFDPRYVHYCRGDSADYRTLHRANAKAADSAVIMTGENKLKAKNAGSALTALALKRSNPDMLLVGEFTEQTNIDSFRFSDVQSMVVNGPELADRLLALACDHPNLVDFVLDMLTYDEFTECCSRSVSALRKRLRLRAGRLTAGELYAYLQAHDINLLAIGTAERMNAADEHPNSSISLNTLMTATDRDAGLAEHDEIIFTCDDVRRLDRRERHRQDIEAPVIRASEQRIFHASRPPQKVLLVGEPDRARKIAERLGEELDACDLIELSAQTESDQHDQQVRQDIETCMKNVEYDCAIFLNGAAGLESIDHDESYLGDTQVILRCQLAKKVSERDERTVPLKIVGEIHHLRNVSLLEALDISAVVPTGILVQRFLSKPMFDRGHVTRLLHSWTDVHQNPRLQSLILDEDHPLVGRSFSDTLRTVYADGRIVACVPKGYRDSLKNPDGDFRTHFITTPWQLEDDIMLGPGDVIVGISAEAA